MPSWKKWQKKQECEITQLRVEEGRVISIPKLLSVLTVGKWSGTIYCWQRRQGLYLDWYLFFTATLLLYLCCCTFSSVCTIVFLFAKDRKVEVDNLLLAKKTRTVSRAKSAIATTNSWPAGNNNKSWEIDIWNNVCSSYYYHFLNKNNSLDISIILWDKTREKTIETDKLKLIKTCAFFWLWDCVQKYKDRKVSTEFCGKIN